MSKNSYDRYGGIVSIIAFSVLLFAVYKGNQPSTDMTKHQMPSFSQPSLIDLDKAFTEHDFRQQYTIVHVWASWCSNCIQEKGFWEQLKKSTPYTLIGLNYRDGLVNARQWLADNGNPFVDHIYDPVGELSEKMGVTGTPETFVVNPNGEIVFHYKGVMTQAIYEDYLLNAIQ